MDVIHLPDWILLNIFSHLSTSSSTYLCAITQVCKQWHKQSINPTLWRALLLHLPRGRVGESLYGKGSGGGSGGGGVDYHRMYVRKRMANRWHTCVYPVSLHGHNAPVVCLDYDGKHAITGSAEGQMKIWNVELGSCTKTFQQHTAAVRAVQFDQYKIISAAEDMTVRLWKMEDGSVNVMQRFKHSLRSLQFESDTMVCGGVNPVISVIDIPTCKITSQLKKGQHSSVVYSVGLRGAVVASGGGDNEVKLWDLRSAECVSTLSHHTSKVRSVQMVGHLLASGSAECVGTLSHHTSKVRSVQMVGHLLASGSEDKTVRFVDIRKMSGTPPLIDTLEFTAPVNAIHFDGLRVAVATTKGVYVAADGQTTKNVSAANATCVRFTSTSPTVIAGYMDYHVDVMDFCPRGRKRRMR